MVRAGRLSLRWGVAREEYGVKWIASVAFVVSLAVFGLTAGPASGQTTDGSSTTTTVAPDTTTTTAPPDATTSTVPPDSTTTTSPSTGPTATTIPQVALPGEHVTDGTLSVGATFKTLTGGDCTASGSVAGGEVNVIRDQNSNIGAVYGKATLGSTQAGLVMVGLGPLPLAITAFRTVGACNQDVVGIGTYASTTSTATFDSVGYGLFPKDFATKVSVSLDASATEPTASLNLQSAYDFLATPRGDEGGVTTTAAPAG
jgi:hypothetical protein